MKDKKLTKGKKRKVLSALIYFIFRKLKNFFRQAGKLFTPDPVAWKSASIGIAVVILILLLVFAFLYMGKLGILISCLSIFYFLITGIAAALGLFLILKLLKIIPDLFKWILTGATVILLFIWPGTLKGNLLIVAITILSASFIAGSAGMLLKKGWKRKRPVNNILNLILLTIGMTGMIYGSYWLLREGDKMDMPVNAALKSDYRPEHISLPNPSDEGNYEVIQLYYGSGKDKHREEYGKNVNILTDSVDGSRFISNWEKFHGWARTKYWGFDDKSLPLNARVWYPGGKGPFPLVLIVHGNHMDRDYSDPGYEYLGKLMASRGFIFASVDENFLNGAWSNIFSSLKEENDCRAWLLLKHLNLWRAWNNDTISPFFKKVNLDRIALIGHSRGGEAVAIAAAFNKLPYYPDDASVKFDFGYKILSVIAIAPVDGQYRPANIPTSFSNVNYFVLQGSHDMDMQSYHGARQYQRIKFTDDDFHIKAGLYIWGANHGQFNTVWRRNDVGYPGIALYNRKQLLPEEDQKKIAKVYISAFLEATLNQKSDYLELFRDYRSGLDWLPTTIYLNLYEDSNNKYICSFEEDIDLTTTTMKSGHISASNLTVWKERMVPLKWGDQDTRAVYTGWNKEEMDSLTGSYTITFEVNNELMPDTSTWLVFALAESKESSNPHAKVKDKENQNGDNEAKNNKINTKENDKISWGVNDHGQINSVEINVKENKKSDERNKKSKDKKNEEKKDSLDFTIVLKDTNNCTIQLPLSHYSYLQPQLEAKIMKADFMTKEAKSEIVFQTFFFPINDFKKKNPGFNPGGIKEIGFVFDRTEEGVVLIDNIGFWKK
jgi:hypothetical protein